MQNIAKYIENNLDLVFMMIEALFPMSDDNNKNFFTHLRALKKNIK
jgi:hypothetical protein